MKKVFLDDLPRYENGANKGNINWKETIGHSVDFVYNNIEGSVKIIDYDKSYLYIKYKQNDVTKTHIGRFKYGGGINSALGKVKRDFRIELHTDFRDNARDITIIDRKFFTGEVKKGNFKVYKYKCNKCGFECGKHYRNGELNEEHWISEYDLLSGKGCACCNGTIVAEGINDIPTTAPWMVKYFQGGYDEAKKYSRGSNTKIFPICPDCGRVKDKEMAISSLNSYQSIGCFCGDRVSYPEKFIFNMLEQLNLKVITQLGGNIFEWCDKYRYDFHIPYIKCIVETHGIQHYKESNRGRTLEEEQENDRLKEQLAKENGIEHYVIIDCRKSELGYIKTNVLNSKLAELFDLSKIDWLKCHEYACDSLVKIACEIKRDNPKMTTTEIGRIMHLSKPTIRHYLNKGSVIWDWCDYDAKKESKKVKKKAVEIFKDGVSLGVFESVSELVEQSEQRFGVKLSKTKISDVCNNRQMAHRGFVFKYI